MSLPEAWSRAALARELAEPTAWLWVVHDRCSGAEPAGYLAARHVAGEASVVSLAVAPEVRRRGAAAALLRSLVRSARSAGVRIVCLEVRAGNRAARRLYARYGFLELTARPRYYPGGEDAIPMELALEVTTAPLGRAGEGSR